MRLKPRLILSKKNSILLFQCAFLASVVALLFASHAYAGPVMVIALSFASGLFSALGLITMLFALPMDDPVQPVGLLLFIQLSGFLFFSGVSVIVATGGNNTWNAWSILAVGYLCLLVVLFVLACVRSLIADWRTWRSLKTFTLLLPPEGIAADTPFTLRYTVLFKRAIPVDTLSICFIGRYRVEGSGQKDEVYGGEGSSPRIQEKTLLSYEAGSFVGHPAMPREDAFSWTLDIQNAALRSCQQYVIAVHIQPQKGSAMIARYPVQLVAALVREGA